MTIRTSLMPHQNKIVDFCEPLPYFGIIAGFGTGKSLALLSLIERRGWKLIIVISTKTAIQSTWPDQISEHSNFYYVKLIGDSKQKFRILKASISQYRTAYGNSSHRPVLVILVNFDGVKNIFQAISWIKPEAIVIDESTRIKNPEAMRSQVMWALGKRVPVRGVMGGFLITDHPTEIYSQIKYLDQGASFGNSYDAFLDEHFQKKKGKYILKRGAAKKIFDKIKSFCIMVPESVIKLPPKVFKKIALDPSEEQENLLASMKDEFRARLKAGDKQSVYSLLSRSMQVCDGFLYERGGARIIDTPKDKALLETIGEIGNKEKMLIFTNYVWSVQKLFRLLSHYGYGVITLFGKTDDPGKIVKVFQNSSKYNVLVSTLAKGNESITLTNCHLGFYYSRNWSNDQFGNSQARIRRKGSEKHNSIIYTDFFLKGTIEEVVRDCVHQKGNMVADLKKYFA